MAILLDGKRAQVPAVRLHGKFAFQEKSIEGDYWVLADSSDPLLLRETWGPQVLQVIRIDRPVGGAIDAGMEGELARNCRVELPGIYFAFASADLESESRPTLASLAAMLSKHSDWTMAIEGHTDSIGGASSNQQLSERRAQAVRAALVSQFHIDGSRLSATGFGATRPRESNATIEGRARNRRVEAVRPCGDKR
jgi:outer membrane protein OmpA-like peptidoglycan-associated protein